MRSFRVTLTCGPNHVLTSHFRYARVRGGPRQGGLATVETVESWVSSSREQGADPLIPPATVQKSPLGFVTAEAPSIASVRSQLEQLRRQKVEEALVRKIAAQAAPHSANNTAEGPSNRAHQGTPLDAIADELKRASRPRSYEPQDASLQQALAAYQHLAQRRCLNDVDDVLRKKRTADSRRLAMMSTRVALHLGDADVRDKATEAFRRRLADKIKTIGGGSEEGSAGMTHVEAGDPIHRLATFMVVEEADAALLKQWIRFGIVDPLWWLTEAEAKRTTATTTSVDDLDEDDDALQLPAVDHALGRTCDLIAASSSVVAASDVPPPDVAPVILKAERGDFTSITERELKALEAYEKGSDKLNLRAWAPSSPLLAELAKDDPKLRASLDILERTKRSSLFDKEFQEALDHVHALEKARYDSIQRLTPKAPRSSADVPYFFGSRLSQPPPAADMNLPPPKASKKQRAQERHRRKLLRLKKRYAT